MRRLIPALLVSLPLALAVACDNGGTPPEQCDDPVATTSAEVVDFAFEPDCLMVEAGASIHLENTGDLPHTFTVEGTSVDLDIAAGEEADAGLGGIEPGRYAVTCTLHPQMLATLEVA
jgi:plastocyanin